MVEYLGVIFVSLVIGLIGYKAGQLDERRKWQKTYSIIKKDEDR